SESVLEASDEAAVQARYAVVSHPQSRQPEQRRSSPTSTVCDNEVVVSLTWQRGDLATFSDCLSTLSNADCSAEGREVRQNAVLLLVTPRNRADDRRSVCSSWMRGCRTRELLRRRNSANLSAASAESSAFLKDTNCCASGPFSHESMTNKLTTHFQPLPPECKLINKQYLKLDSKQTAPLMRHPQAAQDYKDFSQTAATSAATPGLYLSARGATSSAACRLLLGSWERSSYSEEQPNNRIARSTLENLQDEDTQHQQHQQQRLRLRHQTQQAAQHAPSNSTDSECFTEFSPAYCDHCRCHGCASPSNKDPVDVDSLRLVRDQTAQLRRDFQSLREGHKDNVRAMNDMFQENMQSI
uniref:Kinesin motor domain-containing protein n=1 Tax=Macrostomum lignano TaxID=282301 RepID=A0A1I8FAZ0_9PLAT